VSFSQFVLMQIRFDNGVTIPPHYLTNQIFSGVAEYAVVKKPKFFKENNHVL
jgi:hypothetical protein